MRPLLEVLSLSKKYVNGSRPDFEVEEWIASVLNLKRFDLFVQYDRPLEEAELERIREGLRSLKAGLPLAYLTGRAYFWKREFVVTSDVLLPRPETELLVEHSLQMIRRYALSSIADVCTGSGCVGISIKREIPSLHMILSDISEKALEIARINSVHEDLEIRQGDLLAPYRQNEIELVVANPPYLSSNEYEQLDSSVRNFEPSIALLGGKSGLELYERLLLESKTKKVRFLILEIGASQKDRILQIAETVGVLSCEVYQDYSGKDRNAIVQFY